jgi:hypothetical protein
VGKKYRITEWSSQFQTRFDMFPKTPKLIAMADDEALGFPWTRRTTDRLRKNDPDFPPLVELNGRLFIDADDLATYHAVLRARGSRKPGRKPGAATGEAA